MSTKSSVIAMGAEVMLRQSSVVAARRPENFVLCFADLTTGTRLYPETGIGGVGYM